SLDPQIEFTAGTLWFARNAAHRMFKFMFLLLFQCRRDRRPLINFEQGDTRNIYVRTFRGGVTMTFTWNWSHGRRYVELSEIVDFMFAHPELADHNQQQGTSWEELWQGHAQQAQQGIRALPAP